MQIIRVSLALIESLLASVPYSDVLQISLCVMYAYVIEFSIRFRDFAFIKLFMDVAISFVDLDTKFTQWTR